MLQSSTQPRDGSVKGPVIAVVFGGLAGSAMTLQSLLGGSTEATPPVDKISC